MASVLRYPYEAITDKTDYLQVTIVTHPRYGETTEIGTFSDLSGSNTSNTTSATGVQNIAASSLAKAQLAPDGIILLPMPSNIEDSNSVSYDGDTLNSLTMRGFNAVSNFVGGDLLNPKEITDKLKDVGREIHSVITDDRLRKLALTAISAQAVNVFGSNISIDSILARTSGKILNPNMELLFNNVTLRTFRFSFKMTARDEKESVQIKAIIRTFKKNMAAKKADIFLDTPNIFELQYKKGNLAHPFLHKFKQCALSDMSVNYTGENVYATYNDGTPISIILNLTFKELVPIYDDDYPNENLEYSPTQERGGVGY